MDEEKLQSKKTRAAARRALIVGLGAVAIVVLALLTLFSSRGFSSGGLSGIVIQGGSASGAQSQPFAYETGSQQAFTLAGDGLAVASTSSLQLLDSSGGLVGKRVCSFETPAVTACAGAALFFDIGGEGCVLMKPDGTVTDIEVPGEVITASMNPSGCYAVVTRAAGYKGLVNVYDAQGLLLYQWYSGEGYVLKAEVCPDNRHMAALCVTESGSAVHSFSLTSPNERGVARYDGELLFDLRFMNSTTICALGESGIYFSDMDGKKTSEHSFSDWYLCDYSLDGSGSAVLYLSRYRTGAEGTLFAVDAAGKVLGSCRPDGEVLSVSAADKRFLVMTSSALELYSQDMQLVERHEGLVTAKRALLRPDSSVLLLSSYYAEVFKF